MAEFKHVKAEMQRLSFETLEKYTEDLNFLEMKERKKDLEMQFCLFINKKYHPFYWG